MAPLAQVLWLGGRPGSGKTTVATRLARRYGLRWYGADTRTWAHVDRGLAAGIPAAELWHRLGPAERWAVDDDEELLARSFHRERGPMVVEDLRALPDSPLVVAEGSTLPAAAISSGEAERANALWLVSTRDFQDEQLRRRNAPPGPARGFRLLRDQIEREAREHGVPVFVVDGSRSLDETVAAAEERFRVTLAAGPCASTLDERRALLREANESIDAQVRGHLARPWADGDADGSVRELFCECGEPSCEATLARPLRSLAAGPVLAPGH